MNNDIFNLFIKDFTVIDCAIYDYQKGPVGMSWSVDIEFIGKTDNEGVVFDFSHAKKTAKKIIDDLVDHKFVCTHSDVIDHDKNLLFTNNNGLEYLAPKQAFCLLYQTTENSIKQYLEQNILDSVSENILEVRLTFNDEETLNPDNYYYHYTHGLKYHYGNCQRLLHGHKSTVEIKVNGKRNKEYEKYISDYFYNSHVCYKPNLICYDNLMSKLINYNSSQGEFKLIIPNKNLIIMEEETTVENISKEIYNILLKHNETLKNKTVEIHAFEGIGKGSIFVN